MLKKNEIEKRKIVGAGTARVLFFLIFTSTVCYQFISVFNREAYINNRNLEIQHNPLIQDIELKNRRGASASDGNFCHLPNLNPFDREILPFFKKENPVDCTKDEEYPSQILFTIESNGTLIYVGSEDEFNSRVCCYVEFMEQKHKAVSNKCIGIKSRQTSLDFTFEFIGIYCSNSTNDTSKILIDTLHFTPIKPNVESQIAKIRYNSSNNIPNENAQYSVVIFGIDAVSHMNFQRTMPLTRSYLVDSMSALYLDGYTKVGDNTFPNLVPVLTGLSEKELEEVCWSKKSTFDNCPFIWKEFKKEGYRTAYSEDAVWMGIFEYQKKGFKISPTDYYLNPFMRKSVDLIGHRKHGNARLCYGPRLGYSLLLENMIKLSSVMKGKRYFHFTWATSLTHDELNYPNMVDEEMKNKLQQLNTGELLNETILIIMSDHGIRYGSIRSTFQGKIEENMPFLYIVFPKSFKIKYSEAYQNFRLNQFKLTTPFDLHETLLDILNVTSLTKSTIKFKELNLTTHQSDSLPRGISLFLTIPKNRTCELAKIPDSYCVCHSMKQASINSTEVMESATTAVKHLNKILSEYPQCEKLQLENITGAHSVELQGNQSELLLKKPKEYVVLFKTKPGEAHFEGTVISIKNSKNNWRVVGDISRVNEYGNQSRCVEDYKMKKYCYCK